MNTEENNNDFNFNNSSSFWENMVSFWHNNRNFGERDSECKNKADLVDGTVPANQLPSYIDDVIEFETFQNLPLQGEKGKIYVITSDNNQYRWSGTGYIQINSHEDLMTTNTVQDITSQKNFLASNPLTFKASNKKSWLLHKPIDDSLIFSPSQTQNGENWDWANQIRYKDDGSIEANNFIKRNSDNSFLLTGGGGHKPVSDFATTPQLNSYLPLQGGTLNGDINMDTNAVKYNNTAFFSPATSTDVLNIRRYASDYTLLNLVAPPQTTWGGAKEVTLALVRGDNNEYFMDLYNMDYGSTPAGNFLDYGNPEMGLRMQKRGSGVYTVFNFEYGDGTYTQKALQILPGNTTSTTNDTSILVSNSITASQFKKTGSDNNYLLLGGGNHKPLSDFWTSNNFNPANKINAYDNAKSIGFNVGTITSDPYLEHSSGGIVFLATQDWVDTQGYTTQTTVNNQLQNYTTLDTNQTITGQKTFNQGFAVADGTRINLVSNSNPAHYIRRFGDDYDGFGVSAGFAIKRFNDEFNLMRVDMYGRVYTANDGDSLQWKQAYDWGSHAAQGYATQSWVQSQNFATNDYVNESVEQITQEHTDPDYAVNTERKTTIVIITDEFRREFLELGELIPERQIEVINTSDRDIPVVYQGNFVDNLKPRETNEYYISSQGRLIKKGSYRDVSILV